MTTSRPWTTTRADILRRAESWLRPPVPYSQSGRHTNEYGCYRTDCSGYVSMAWGLPGDPLNHTGGLDTAGLREFAVPITKQALRPGDILLHATGPRPDRHVTLFVAWADGLSSTYLAFEQAGGTGTVLRTIPYPYGADAPYVPMCHPSLRAYGFVRGWAE